MKNTENVPAASVGSSELLCFEGWLHSVEAELASVKQERLAQLRKWGVQKHDLPTWMAILSEEVGELSQEVLKVRFAESRTRPFEEIRREALQVAAVAAAIAQVARDGQA